jgi:hypothetical protein
MTFGLQVRKANNAVSYSSDSVTWNQVGFFLVSGGGSASFAFPVLAGREVLTAQVMIDAPPLTRKAIAHTITVSGTTVSVSGGSENTYILVMMR